MPETDCRYKNLPYICTRIQQKNGALVQLVRIRACHARGQGFESPTHRQSKFNQTPEIKKISGVIYFYIIYPPTQLYIINYFHFSGNHSHIVYLILSFTMSGIAGMIFS